MNAAILMLAMMAAADGRVGLFVGSNGAPRGREPLEHAEADARNMRRVFVELGNLAASDAHLLEAPTAEAILEAITKTAAGARVLVFYYSGHADSRALLLEGSELSFVELDRALTAAGAELRLELIDACRSGAMTRNKGATLGDRLNVAEERGEGRVVISSSAEWEDSHESDQLGGSFFTLHMATGLRGAADEDRDGKVTLTEAYRYVYGRTVESTIASGAGVQHPSFNYELSGRGELVLTWPPSAGGTVTFDRGDYVVIDHRTGRVAAEVNTANTRITLPAGAYRIHKRTRDEVWSGLMQVETGATVRADSWLLEREAHARLVRKGRSADPALSHAVRLMGGVRGKVGDVERAPMFRGGYELSLPWLSVKPYVFGTLGSELSTPRLRWTNYELGAGAQVSRAIDLPLFTLRGGLGAEVIRISQSEAEDRERARSTYGSAVVAAFGFETRPLWDFFLAVNLEAVLYVYRATDAAIEPAGNGEIVTEATYRAFFGLGYEL